MQPNTANPTDAINLTVAEVAKLMDVSEDTVRAWADDGMFGAFYYEDAPTEFLFPAGEAGHAVS